MLAEHAIRARIITMIKRACITIWDKCHLEVRQKYATHGRSSALTALTGGIYINNHAAHTINRERFQMREAALLSASQHLWHRLMRNLASRSKSAEGYHTVLFFVVV